MPATPPSTSSSAAVCRAPSGTRRATAFVVLLSFVQSARAAPIRDTDRNCAHWAEVGECEANPSFMKSACAASCAAIQDTGGEECLELEARGRCRSHDALSRCSGTCFRALKRNLTEDLEGNCWYWGTDGECAANPQWMSQSCSRSCEKLSACTQSPHSAACARPFECPLERDKDDEQTCRERARRGECRAKSIWSGQTALTRCPFSCFALDPPSASKAVTRPIVKRSRHIDAPVPRHQPRRCHHVGLRQALLSGICPNDDRHVPWRRRLRRCPRTAPVTELMTPRVADAQMPEPAELPAAALKLHGNAPPERSPAVRLQLVHESPRVRLLHHFITAHEAAELIRIAEPRYHRSSTARAGSDDKRTSNSATLPSSEPVVRALRHRIAFFCGYPEPNLEPLQAVRYRAGEYYRPHHDYYNACETWLSGNRHFTFLVYLNEPEAGGETAFPRLNISLKPVAYTALVFNNCLDNGEPDERSLHEGVPPERGFKYAINGWVRSKHLFD